MSTPFPVPGTHPLPRAAVDLPTVVWVNVVLGLPAYFLAFLVAYGFRDHVGLPEHALFLGQVGAFATVTGLLAATITVVRQRRSYAGCAVVGVLSSLALNAAVVAVGSVVSALHKQDGSVSADFSTATDVLVAGGLLVVAVVLGRLAGRVASRLP